VANVGEPVIVGVPWVDPFPGSYHASSTAWHFGKPQTDVIVTCVATFASLGKTVTIKGKITSHAPIHYWNCAIGDSTISQNAIGETVARLWGAEVQYLDGQFSGIWGIWYGGHVTTQIQLQSNGPGWWHFDQKLAFGRTRSGAYGSEQLYEQQGAGAIPVNGVWGLDVSHPYNQTFSSDGTEAYDNDKSEQTLGNGQIYSQYQIYEPFKTCLMYQSGRPGSIEVPLRIQQWRWEIVAFWNGTEWIKTGGNSGLIQPTILYPYPEANWAIRHDPILISWLP
jgi:hypothetical protein